MQASLLRLFLKLFGVALAYAVVFATASTASTHHASPAKAGHFIHLTWKPGKGGTVAVGYNVYRTTGKRRHFRKLNRSLVGKPAYDDRTVRSGVTYRYMVTGVDAKGGESGFSNQIRLSVPP